MSELKSQAVKIFDNTLESITGAESVERAKDTCHLARGYITGLRLLGLITDLQFDAMDKLLDMAVDAVTQRIKRTASGVTSTESGSNRGCPLQDDNEYTISITAINFSVKKEEEHDETLKAHS